MKPFTSMSRAARATLFLAAMLGMAGAAQAQVFRAYLSAYGSDANPCTIAAPCRLLPAALAAVADGGEVWMLDSANYNTGQVAIHKSVTILAIPGVVGSLVANGNSAVVVSEPGVVVTFRNLSVSPVAGQPGSGIHVAYAKQVSIEDCVVANLSGLGIFVDGTTTVSITNTIVRNGAMDGILVRSGAKVHMRGVTVSGNSENGISVMPGNLRTSISVADSVIEGNAYAGIFVRSSGAAVGDAIASVTRSRIARNATGIQVLGDTTAAVVMAHANTFTNQIGWAMYVDGANGKAIATRNVASGNGNGFARIGGAFQTGGDNFVKGNTTLNVAGGTTVVSMQ